MQTREGTRRVDTATQQRSKAILGGFGYTAKVVGSGLLACLLLIGAAAIVSMCWQIHPLLTVAAVAGLGWITWRLASLLLVPSGRGDRLR